MGKIIPIYYGKIKNVPNLPKEIEE